MAVNSPGTSSRWRSNTCFKQPGGRVSSPLARIAGERLLRRGEARHPPAIFAKFAKTSVDRPARFWFYFRPFAGKFMYAVLETGSKQYRVAAGDTLEIERLETEAGKPFTFDRVLLVNNEGKLAVGAPTVDRRHRRGRRGRAQARREETHVQDETPQGLSQNHRPSSGTDRRQNHGHQRLTFYGT